MLTKERNVYLLRNWTQLFLSVNVISESGFAFPFDHFESKRQFTASDAEIIFKINIQLFMKNRNSEDEITLQFKNVNIIIE
jgi:hypothetical protein